MSNISKKYQKTNTLTLERFNQGMGLPILLGILFFFVLCLGAADSIKTTVMVVAAFTLIVIAARFMILRDRIYWPFIALTLVVLMDGISTFYAVSGKFALREFLKVFLAYLMAVCLLATSPKNEEVKGKRIATILAVCTAIGSLVSIDLISTRWISGAVTWVLGHFTEAYEDLFGMLTDFSRISSPFDNSNVFAGFAGLGALCAFGLADASSDRKERCFYLSVLYENMLAFLLTVSLGASLVICVALIAMIILKDKDGRFHTIVLLVEMLLVSVAFAGIVSKTSFKMWAGPDYIPLLCAVVGAVLLCGLDFISKPTADWLNTHRKGMLTAIIVLFCAGAAFLLVGFNYTKGINLSANETLTRTAHPKPGEYEMSVQADGKPLNLTVKWQTKQDLMLGQYQSVYEGSAYNAAFEIPEDCAQVVFVFDSPEGTHIESAAYNGKRLPLRYVLLPNFLVGRLHSPFTLGSPYMRLTYFQDGLKLFRRSPVIGLGLGAFENGIKSVQTFYYETKYAHNHYFQTLLETGVIGLALFLVLLVSSAIAIWKSRETQPFAPMLGTLWIFMVGQALHDIVFSAFSYLPLAFGCFAMISLCCGDTITRPKLTKTAETVSVCVISACTVIYCGFLSGNLIAKRAIEKEPTLQTLIRCVEMDRFEWADYALPYVTNSMGTDVNPYVRQQADLYAERLAKVNSNTIPIYLAEYYFSSERPEQGFVMIEKYIDYVSSDRNAWQTAFDVLRNYDDGSEMFRSGVVQIAKKLDTWNEENTGFISLDETASAYIASCRS